MSQDDGRSEEALTRAQLRAERRHMQRLRVSEAGVALAALLVSLTVLGVNFYTYRRGSEMVVLQPEQVLFFRDAGPNGASLTVAVQAPIVNAARDHGDVVVRASALLDPDGEDIGRFSYSSLVEPVLSPKVQQAVESCPMGARCIPATGFYVIDRPKRLLDVPGGSSRTEFLSFPIHSSNCAPADEPFCQQFTDYASAVAFLRKQRRNVIAVEIEFQFDGSKSMECLLVTDQAAKGAIFDYLEEKGWAMPACTAS